VQCGASARPACSGTSSCPPSAVAAIAVGVSENVINGVAAIAAPVAPRPTQRCSGIGYAAAAGDASRQRGGVSGDAPLAPGASRDHAGQVPRWSACAASAATPTPRCRGDPRCAVRSAAVRAIATVGWPVVGGHGCTPITWPTKR
jgi:hypothetical protein